MADKTHVLFICKHNSGRSQIAAAYANQFGKGHVLADSAGLEPAGTINPLVMEVMKEEGFDLSGKKPQSVFTLYKQGVLYDYVITVCDSETEDKCPIFPGITHRSVHPFPDPDKIEGNEAEKINQVKKIRDMIKAYVLNEHFKKPGTKY